MAKHLIILVSINNIYKLKKASKALLKELLYIINVTVLKRNPKIGTIAL